MIRRLLFGSLPLALITLLSFVGFVPKKAEAQGGELENLQFYPKSTSKKDMKKKMKAISKALGVQCDHCHDMGDMAADSKHKNEARKYLRLVARENASKELKRYGAKISCQTCHRGKAKPSR